MHSCLCCSSAGLGYCTSCGLMLLDHIPNVALVVHFPSAVSVLQVCEAASECMDIMLLAITYIHGLLCADCCLSHCSWPCRT